MFFSFDGIDGVGKTTQIGLFCQWLRIRGSEVVACRDPGGTPVGEAIRELLLGKRGEGISLTAEMLLYMAARAQMVEQIIIPALDRGAVVVSDRFLLANVVYQGYAGGLDPQTIRQIGHVATRGIEPDLTFLLDMPESAASARLNRHLDRMEQRGDDFRAMLRRGYLAEAARRPDKIVMVAADRSIEVVHNDICRAAEKVLRSSSPN